MPGPAGARPWWASLLDLIVTDDGATVNLGGLSNDERQGQDVTNEDVGPLLTAAVERLYLPGCKRLTDACVNAVAANCPNLLTLSVWGCSKLTSASLRTVADNSPNLEILEVVECDLFFLPANIGKLSRLRSLNAWRNHLKELPRSIVDLDASCSLALNGNPLQLPPLKIARQGIPAIKRYFDDLDGTA